VILARFDSQSSFNELTRLDLYKNFTPVISPMSEQKEDVNGADLWKAGEQRNPPCPEELISLVEERVGCPLPDDYRQFMLAGNGQPDTVEPRIRSVIQRI
jgi:hypothetical protein